VGEYVGLEGIRGGKLKPRGKHYARTVTGFMTILRKGRVCSSAGDLGACTVWRDDKGVWHCDFSRWRSSVNEATFTSKAGVQRWLKEWLPQMHAAAQSEAKRG
jgi:hypothetical protein